MPGSRPLRRLLAASLLFTSSVLALPSELHIVLEDREVAQAAPLVWVTVGASAAETITPSVVTADGATSTSQAAPESLTTTGTYTLLPISSAPTTSTGLPPVATASSDSGTGAFLACDVYVGIDAPFCQPKAGTQLGPGNTYYVTWSPDYFSNASTSLEVQGIYHDGSGDGFTSPRLNVTQGYYAWTVDSDLLAAHSTSDARLNVTLSLVQFDDDTSSTSIDSVDGPGVIVTTLATTAPASSSRTNVVAIAVPVVVVVVLLGLAGLCVFSWRKHGRVPFLGGVLGQRRRAAAGRSGLDDGYAVQQNRAEQGSRPDPRAAAGADKTAGSEIQLTDRDSWSPSTSPRSDGQRNVFREELERQERER